MQLLDCSLIGLDGGTETVAFRTNSNAVAVVAEGRGTSRIGGTSFAWEPRDIFTLPRGHWITHKAEGDAKLFISSDRDMLRRLDILVEEFGAA